VGIFNRLGRKAEQLRRQVSDAKAEEATHRCDACDELLFTDRETCPECGSDAVVSL
jgi:uncharacterized OB-fold protein